MQHRISTTGTALDGLAIAMWVACVLHCLMLPLLIVLFPILGSTLLAEETFHGFLLFLIIPSSVLALYIGCRQHGDGWVLALGMAGLSILAAAAALGTQILGPEGEKALTGLGGTVLAIGHWQNFRRCRERRCEERDACTTADAVVWARNET